MKSLPVCQFSYEFIQGFLVHVAFCLVWYFYKCHIFYYNFSIEQLFSPIVLGNQDDNLSYFKLLFRLYVILTVFSGKIWSISWLLCNKGKCFLIMVLLLRSNGLYCVIKLHEAEKLLLILGLLASSLEMFLTFENCFLTLLGL